MRIVSTWITVWTCGQGGGREGAASGRSRGSEESQLEDGGLELGELRRGTLDNLGLAQVVEANCKAACAVKPISAAAATGPAISAVLALVGAVALRP